MKIENEFEVDNETGMLILPMISKYGELRREIHVKQHKNPVYSLIGKTKLMFIHYQPEIMDVEIYDVSDTKLDEEALVICEKVDEKWICGFNWNLGITHNYIDKIFETEEAVDEFIKSL